MNPGAKQLASGYSLERDYYLASEKTQAAAAGGVAEASRDYGTNKPLNALTLDEYIQLFDQAVSGFDGNSNGYEVVYLSKSERIRY